MRSAPFLFLLLACPLLPPTSAQECAEFVPPKGPWNRRHALTRIATGCSREVKDDHVLQIMEPLCVFSKKMFTPCPSIGERFTRTLEWAGINKLLVLPPGEFEKMRDAHGPVEWYNGTSYGSYLGQFPHAVQGLMPILNLRAMGMPHSRFVQLPAYDNFPSGHGLDHPYNSALISSLSSCLGVDSIVGQREWWRPRVMSRTTVCFERMVVPIIRGRPCGHVFMEHEWARPMMQRFRSHVFRTLDITPAPSVPRTITYLHRASNRRIINRLEVLEMIKTFNWELKVVETEKEKPFREQVS